jgi:hypothetical protein
MVLPSGGVAGLWFFAVLDHPPAKAVRPDASGRFRWVQSENGVRKMANNLRIVERIQGGHYVIISCRLDNSFRPVSVCDGPKN